MSITMWLFRRLHFFILFSLGLMSVFFLGASLFLITNSATITTTAQKHFKELLAAKELVPVTPDPVMKDSVSISFGTLHVATESSTLTHVVGDNEELFIPLFSSVKVETIPVSFSPAYHPKLRIAWDEEQVRSWVVSISTNITTHAQSPSLTYTPGINPDRKSTRLNSSHQIISYAVFCLKKKKHYTY